jgi:hypothetical protein
MQATREAGRCAYGVLCERVLVVCGGRDYRTFLGDRTSRAKLRIEYVGSGVSSLGVGVGVGIGVTPVYPRECWLRHRFARRG